MQINGRPLPTLLIQFCMMFDFLFLFLPSFFSYFFEESQGMTDIDHTSVFTHHEVSKPIFATMNLFWTYVQNMILIPV